LDLLLLLIFLAIGLVWAGSRAQSGDRYDSATLHPGQVLRGSLPLLSPIFGYILGKRVHKTTALELHKIYAYSELVFDIESKKKKSIFFPFVIGRLNSNS
jgi:hypothetical protein